MINRQIEWTEKQLLVEQNTGVCPFREQVLSHFPRDFYEMRIRNDRTPFMDKIKKLLLIRMDDPKKPCDKG